MLQKYNILFFTILLYLFGLTLTNVSSVFALDLDEDVCPKYTRGADGSIQFLNPKVGDIQWLLIQGGFQFDTMQTIIGCDNHNAEFSRYDFSPPHVLVPTGACS